MSDVEIRIAEALYGVLRTWPGRLTEHHDEPGGPVLYTTGEAESSLAIRMATAVVTLLNGTAEDDHVVRLTDTGFTIQHPLVERIDSTLFDCTVHRAIVDYFDGGGGAPKPGEYRIVFNKNGGWAFEPVKQQREEIDE